MANELNAKRLSKLRSTVDGLGMLRAQLAPLKKQEAALVEELKKAGVEVAEGTLYDASISTYTPTNFNATKAKKFLQKALSPAAYKTYFAPGKEKVSVRVTAKKREQVAA